MLKITVYVNNKVITWDRENPIVIKTEESENEIEKKLKKAFHLFNMSPYDDLLIVIQKDHVEFYCTKSGEHNENDNRM